MYQSINLILFFLHLSMHALFFNRTAVYDAEYREILDELDQATNFLHENGILLHFDDSSLLSDLYFLDPQWLCSTLAKVITIQRHNPYQKNGKASELLWQGFIQWGGDRGEASPQTS